MTFMRVDVATTVLEREISAESRVRHSVHFLVHFQVSQSGCILFSMGILKKLVRSF